MNYKKKHKLYNFFNKIKESSVLNYVVKQEHNDSMKISVDEEVYRNKREIFDHFKLVFEDQTRIMEETY